MRRDDELQARKGLLERGDQAALPAGMQMKIELVDEHESLHLLGLEVDGASGCAGLPQDVADDVGEPGDRRLVTVRQPGRGELDDLSPGLNAEAVAGCQAVGGVGPSPPRELELLDVGEQLLVSEEHPLEHLGEGQGLLAVELIGEARADELAAIEQGLDVRADQIFGAAGRAGLGSERRTP